VQWDLESFGDDEPDEATWMTGRLPGYTYASTSFPLKRPGSDDHGQPARFIIKVYDDDGQEDGSVELDGEVWPIETASAGRAQIKLLVARQSDHIKDLWIQKLRTAKDGQLTAGNVLHLDGRDAESLAELFRNLSYVPITGEGTTRIDDALLKRIFADPSALATYDLDPDVIRALIEMDATATDVVATAGRKAAVERFRRMLDDHSYFASEKSRLGVRGDEAVWQSFFEENPWILGAGLTSQLLTSWDDDRLEQVVAGYSIGGSGKRADAVLRTAGIIRSMVFAEFKTDTTSLLQQNEYRPGCWGPSKELVGGVAQAQATIHAAVANIGSRIATLADDGSDVPGDWTYLFQPRSFLVVGSLGEFVGENGGHHAGKIRSFELYRRNTAFPEIVTFDELFARAEWITNLS
jgi:hypothetical protein